MFKGHFDDIQSMMELFVHTWILNILTHFLEVNTRMMPDFLYIIKYKKKKKRNL